ncbi:MAG TPA: hypothetical protein VMZ53_30770 [Kofleriaceae bacterium]|nr:hypothetical protein [Kofleriaceae bacterium]
MAYRDNIDALAARKTALAAEVDTKQRELAQTSRMLEEIRAKARLPVLPNIRVASPCTADWNAMTPVDADVERVRHCGSCDKNVYNLTQMTRDEAEALILAKEGRLCVRYFQRKDGTILLKDCTVGVSKKRKRRLIAAGAAALLAGGAGAAATYIMHTDSKGKTERYEAIAGGIGPTPGYELQGQLEPTPPPPELKAPKRVAKELEAKELPTAKKHVAKKHAPPHAKRAK